ncbi:hypothetical protein DFH06DRAFT_1157677 [Mycena polygramma]|nr:hypothetical protein DFH06DRAFT_1157677 [Mycena polygramma]
MPPIVLFTPTLEKSNPDASVKKYTLSGPPYVPGPYTRPPSTLPFLPSLPWFCLNKLAEAGPEQVGSILNVRLNYQPPESETAYDLLCALVPSLPLPEFDWASVDPRLWATIIQIYDNLPSVFQSYPIPLADMHLPLLQQVKCTPIFSLATILELPGCRELSDTTVVNLKHLHSLCALDASDTALSAHGLKILSGTVLWNDRDRKGPWGLRILRLRNCRAIDDKIFPYLAQFILLSILDVRGTQCQSNTFFPTFQPAPSTEHPLYHPTPLRLSVALLASTGKLFSSPNVFTLYINTLHHPPTAERPVAQATHGEDDCVTFISGSSRVVVGSSAEVPEPHKRHPVRPPNRERKPNFENGGSRLASSGSYMPDFALQNRIAEQETDVHAARQDIMSFYHSVHVAPPRNSFRGYKYPLEGPLPPSPKDAQLMLYRLPPPWAALEATTPDVQLPKPAALPEVVTGVSTRKKAEMEEYVTQLNEKRRKVQVAEAAAGRTVLAAETAPLSRNPFRRKAKDALPSSATALPNPVLGKRARTSSLCNPKDATDKILPRVQQKSAFNWNTWGKG